MAHEWNLKTHGRACASCEAGFKNGDECVSSLYKTEDGYERRDICQTCFADGAASSEPFSQWQWVYEVVPPPSRQEPVKSLTAETLLRQLIALEDPDNANVVYILAIMLERKKQLIERDVKVRDEGGMLRIYEHRPSGDTLIILDPQLNLDAIGEVQQEVIKMLGEDNTGSETAEGISGVEAGRDDFDILIRGGWVIDGSGEAGDIADIAIRDGKIVEVGEIDKKATAGSHFDASGLLVTPGFIDVHSHSDAYVLVEPDAPSKVRQGVTTEVVGQCGCSAAPLRGQARHPSDWEEILAKQGLAPGGEGDFWRSMSGYRDKLRQSGHAVNMVALVGHNTLRAGVMGYEGRAAGPEEVAMIVERLEQALDEGASGFTTGLIYSPGASCEPEEVLALAKAAAAKDAHYATHMRSEGALLEEALDEVLAVTRATGIRTQISHLKTAGKANWHKLDNVLKAIEKAKSDGFHVYSDRYPYVFSGTSLDTRLPKWAQPDGREAILSRINDPLTSKRIIDEMTAAADEDTWRDTVIGSTTNPALYRFRGKSIAAVSEAWRCTPAEAFVQVLRLDKNETSAFFGSMSEDNLKRIYAQPWMMVGSDGSIRATDGVLSHDYPHPRGYASFVRFLRLANEGYWGFSVEEAVRRITSLPAEAFRLGGRGRLEPGAWADVVILDPGKLQDGSSFANPHRYPEGVLRVIVNGRPVFCEGRHGERSGRWLVSGQSL